MSAPPSTRPCSRSWGRAILIAWLASIALTVALFRQRFADEAFGWALRIGMLITVLGQATGGIMTTPTQAQFAAARTTRIAVAGAHTVGAPDGGAGLPITGWSRQHGDVRVAHFIGLHAVQLLPATAWLIGPLGSAVRRRRSLLLVAAGYFSLFAILLAQALSGQPLLAPQGSIALAFGVWAVVATAGLLFIAASQTGGGRRAAPVRGVAMTIEGLFSACNLIAMAGWILLLAVPKSRRAY